MLSILDLLLFYPIESKLSEDDPNNDPLLLEGDLDDDNESQFFSILIRML